MKSFGGRSFLDNRLRLGATRLAGAAILLGPGMRSEAGMQKRLVVCLSLVGVIDGKGCDGINKPIRGTNVAIQGKRITRPRVAPRQ